MSQVPDLTVTIPVSLVDFGDVLGNLPRRLPHQFVNENGPGLVVFLLTPQNEKPSRLCVVRWDHNLFVCGNQLVRLMTLYRALLGAADIGSKLNEHVFSDLRAFWSDQYSFVDEGSNLLRFCVSAEATNTSKRQRVFYFGHVKPIIQKLIKSQYRRITGSSSTDNLNEEPIDIVSSSSFHTSTPRLLNNNTTPFIATAPQLINYTHPSVDIDVEDDEDDDDDDQSSASAASDDYQEPPSPLLEQLYDHPRPSFLTLQNIDCSLPVSSTSTHEDEFVGAFHRVNQFGVGDMMELDDPPLEQCLQQYEFPPYPEYAPMMSRVPDVSNILNRYGYTPFYA